MILVIDDDPDLTGLIKVIMESENIETLSAASGEEALEIFEENKDNIELIFADYNMPKMNGLDILAKLRAAGSNIPYLLVTAFCTQEVLARALRLGVLDLIQKPFTPEELTDICFRAMNISKSQSIIMKRLDEAADSGIFNDDKKTKILNELQHIPKFLALNDISR
jgi:CheY-like chemotaxis protein